jgi:hypothetical protein
MHGRNTEQAKHFCLLHAPQLFLNVSVVLYFYALVLTHARMCVDNRSPPSDRNPIRWLGLALKFVYSRSRYQAGAW